MIATISVALAGIACLALFVWFWRRDNGGSTVATPFLHFAALEVFINWPAAFLAPVMGWSRDYYPLAMALLGFLSFLVAVLFTSAVLRMTHRLPIEYRSREILTASPTSYLLGSLLLGGVLLALGLFMYGGVPPIVDTVIAGIRGNALEAAVSLTQDRQMLTKAHYFGGEHRGQGLIRMLMRVGWPFLTGIALCLYVRTKQRRWALLGALWFLLTFVFVAGEGTRAPFIFAIIFLLVLVSLITRLRYRVIALGAASLVGLMIAMSLLSTKLQWALQQEDAAVVMATRIGERVAYGNGSNTVLMIELVRGGDWSYRLGEVHLQRLLNSIPGVQSGRPLSYELYRALNPAGTATTYASATYLGDVFVDFGPVGVVAIYFGMGILVMVLQRVLLSVRRTVLNTVSVAYVIFSIGFIPLTGVIGFLAVLPLVGVVYVLPYLGTKLRVGRVTQPLQPMATA